MDDADQEGRSFMKLIDQVIEKPQEHDLNAVTDRVEQFFGIPRPEATGWLKHVMGETKAKPSN